MIKFLYWLANKLSKLKSNIKCRWNTLLINLFFNIKDCPNKLCKCKK